MSEMTTPPPPLPPQQKDILVDTGKKLHFTDTARCLKYVWP